jgi:hypothetical protein
MLRSLRLVVAIVVLGSLFIGSAAALDVMILLGDRCLANTWLISVDEAINNREDICRQIGREGDWVIVRLKDGGAMGGPGYKGDDRQPCNIVRKFDFTKTPVGGVLCGFIRG